MTEPPLTAMTALEIVKKLVLPSAPSRVWKALTDPDELVQWFPDERADIEAEPGHEGHWVWKNHGSYAVRFDVVDPPHRLVWSWARDPDVPLGETVITTVEFRLEPGEDGGTTLSVRESGFVREQDRAGNDTGWDKELGELAEYLAEAKERWGGTGAYAESSRRTKSYTDDDWAIINGQQEAIEAGLAAAMADGEAPEGDRAKVLAEQARLHIDRWFYPCSAATHVGLAELYLTDPRFRAHYDDRSAGLAEYVARAIRANASGQPG
jgi:uncharacterized protein YndB with AHSA1/START domain